MDFEMSAPSDILHNSKIRRAHGSLLVGTHAGVALGHFSCEVDEVSLDQIRSLSECLSPEERKQRFGVTFANVVIWGLIALIGVVLLLGAFAESQDPEGDPGAAIAPLFVIGGVLFVKFVVGYLVAEYNVRQLQAMGAAVHKSQFTAVYKAAQAVQRHFNIKKEVRVLVIASGETNAFAIKFARKHVVVLLSELLEGVIDNPEELLAILGHEICHTVLDHGLRGEFEIYKPARYRQARELTCDIAGYVAAGEAEATKAMLKKLAVGKELYVELSDEALAEEARYIYSGLTGWFLRRHLSHPPVGSRIRNIDTFAAEHPAPPPRRREEAVREHPTVEV